MKSIELTVSTALSQLLQFAIFIILARSLGPTEFGHFTVSLVVSVFLVTLIDFGQMGHSAREIAFKRLAYDTYLTSVASKALFIGALCLATFSAGVIFESTTLYTISALTFSQSMFSALQAGLRGSLQTKKLSASLITDRALCLALVVIAVSLDVFTIGFLCAAWTISQIIACLVGLGISGVKRFRPKHNAVSEIFSYGKSTHFGVFTLAYNVANLDQLILGALFGPTQTGIYSAVSKWFAPVNLIGGIFSTITSNSAASRYATALEAIRSEKLKWFGLVGLGLTVVFASIHGGDIVILALGKEFEGSLVLLPWLGTISAIALINQPLASIVQYFGGEKYVGRVMLFTVLLYLCVFPALAYTVDSNPSLIMVLTQCGLQLVLFASLIFKLFQTPMANRS